MSALASPADLEARLGRDLTPEETARAQALLDDASALVRSYTGRDFSEPADYTATLRLVAGEIVLPQKPVVSVTSVAAVGGMPAVPDLPIVDYAFDGIDRIRLGTCAWAINLPEAWWDDDYVYPGTYKVAYRAGYEAIPADVVMVVCGMVLRALTAPTMMGGVRSETIGSYSYQLDAASGGLAVSLTAGDRQVLDRYRRTAGSIQLRLR